MLTSEQTKIRHLDAEIIKLKRDKERFKSGFIELIKGLIQYMPSQSHKNQLRDALKELEDV